MGERGCFTQAPLSPRERQLKAQSARLWLSSLLHSGSRPVVEIFKLAADAWISARGLWRAKWHLQVKAASARGFFGSAGHWEWFITAEG